MPDESKLGGPSEFQAPPAGTAKDGGPDLLRPEEMDTLLANARPGAPHAGGTPRSPHAAGGAAPATEQGVAPRDIEFLLHQAEEALASVHAPTKPDVLAGIAPFRLEEFGAAAPSAEMATIELIRDVELDLKIELGRTQMYLEDVLKLHKGSVVTLDKMAGDPVDIFVNGRLIARGEVLVLNDNFCVRVAELITGEAARAG